MVARMVGTEGEDGNPYLPTPDDASGTELVHVCTDENGVETWGEISFGKFGFGIVRMIRKEMRDCMK
jgi:hypothetical protein